MKADGEKEKIIGRIEQALAEYEKDRQLHERFIIAHEDKQEDLLLGYVQDISRYPIPSSELLDRLASQYSSTQKYVSGKDDDETHRLFKDYGSRIKSILITSHLRMVINTAKRYDGKGIELLDNIQEGNLGLMEAVEKFRPDKGSKFKNCALAYINKRIRRNIENRSRTIRWPVNQWHKKRTLSRVYQEILGDTGREPTEEELEKNGRMTYKTMKLVLDAPEEPTSLDETKESPEGDTIPLSEIVSDDRYSFEEESDKRLCYESLEQNILSTLKQRDADILRMRPYLELKEIAEKVGLSAEGVRQSYNRNLSRIRDAVFSED